VRDLLIEVGIGIAVVIIALLCAAHGPFTWMPHRKWITLGMLTASVFGVPAWWYRRDWGRPVFWILFLVLLAVHVLAYSTLLSRTKEFPPLLDALSIPLEWAVIFPVLSRANRLLATDH